MTKTYQKALTKPKTWKGVLVRKEKYVMKANPRGYQKELVIPAGIVLKLLGLAKTTREVKNILQNKKVQVNSKKINTVKFGVGFTDVIDVEGLKYRCNLDAWGELIFEPANEDYNLKPVKVIGKTTLKGKKIQINFNDGSNILVDDVKKYGIGDTIVLELPDKKIKEALALKEGANMILTKGKHSGDRGTIIEIKGKYVIYEDKEKRKIQTLKDYVFVKPKILQ